VLGVERNVGPRGCAKAAGLEQLVHGQREADKPYEIRGAILESCSCRTPCPCWIGADPDDERCLGFNAYHITRGTVDGVDVAGCDLVRVFDIRGNPREPGSWRQVVVISDSASDEQASSMLAAYTGVLGGPLSDLAHLVDQTLGVERASITYRVAGGEGTVRAGKLVDVSISPFRGADGVLTTLHDSLMTTVPRAPAYISRANFHEVALAKYGFEWRFEGRSAIQSDYRVSNCA
jgi:hypothetical protein